MVLLAAGCFASASPSAESPTETPSLAAPIVTETAVLTSVSAVSVSGDPVAYNFDVTVRSLDIGCEGYADWLEVVSEDGELLHNHVDEHPFSRSGGPVTVVVNDTVVVRAHMNSTGYSGSALRGSVEVGFIAVAMPPDFAARLAERAPLPSSCAF